MAQYTTWRVYERKGKGWFGAISYKADDGRWKNRERKLSVKDKRAAEAECKAWFERENEAEGSAVQRAPQTVLEYLSAYVDGVAVTAEPSTVNGYRYILRRQVEPFEMAGAQIDDLGPEAVRAWLAEVAAKYSAASTSKAFVLVRSAMRQAVNDGRLQRNPTDGMKAPKRKQPEPNAIPEAQRKRLAAALAQAAQTPDVVAMQMALYTGMREGEICGLRWRNVDLSAMTLDVREAIGKDNGRYYVKEPKTGGSRRTVCYPEPLAVALRARRAEVAAQCLEACIPFSPDMFVLGRIDTDERTGDYRFYNPHVLWERWRVMADLLGLVGTQGKRPTFHDLRHTYATTAIAAHVDVKTVSSSLGHANAAMTLNIYADADPDAKRRGAEAVAQAMAGGTPTATLMELRTGTND